MTSEPLQRVYTSRLVALDQQEPRGLGGEAGGTDEAGQTDDKAKPGSSLRK